MGGEASKVRHLKSTSTKKLAVSPTPQHILPPAIKVANSVSCNDNLLNVGKALFLFSPRNTQYRASLP